MNRRHNAHEAIQSVELAQLKGFDNINIDLIYGLPSMTQNRWKDNLRQAFDLDILHLSAYHLTIEPRTVFGRRQNKGDNFSINEEDSIRQFECLLDAATEAGFEHYEISNFAKPGFHSRHNSNYWRHLPYLGIGPSAHSYDGKSRQWNVGNNSQYIENIEKEDGWCESELLSPFDMYNDYMLISIRTMWGVNPGYILENFGPTFLEIFLRQAASYIQSGFMEKCNGKYVLTRKGKMIADRIASDLFADEDTMNILETRLKYTGLIY